MATPFSSSIVKIKTKLLPRWPASVNATAPIVSTKANGAVTLSYDSSSLPLAGGLPGTAKVLFRDGTSYSEIAATGIAFGTIANDRIVGNVSGGTAAPIGLTAAQVAALLPTMTGDTGTGGVVGFVPAPPAGSAAAGKYLKADGTFAVPPGAVSSVAGRTGAIVLDAPDVGFTPAGTSAVATTVDARLKCTVNVFDFMTAAQIADVKAGTQALDVSSAIQAALNYRFASISGLGGRALEVVFPPGIYKCANRLTVSNTSIRIVGSGLRNTTLIFSSATASQAGVSISQDSYIYSTDITNLTIRTSIDQPNNDALTVTYPYADSGKEILFTATNVEVDGGSSDGFYWLNGIVMSYCWNATLFSCNVRGKNPGAVGVISGSNMQVAFKILGSVPPDFGGCTGMSINRCYSQYSVYSVRNMSDSEGVVINSCLFISSNYGVYWSVATSNYPNVFIVASHISSYIACCVFGDVQQLFVNGNLFYKRPDSTQNWNGIYLSGVFDSTFSNNVFIGYKGTATGTANAFAFAGGVSTADNIISGNIAVSVNYFVDLASITSVNVFSNNYLASNNTPSGWITNSSGTAIWKNNYPENIGADVGYSVITGATPSVGGTISENFRLTNGGATTVTNFTNGYVGQVLYIVAQDNNSTVQHNAGMLLKGGVNFAMASGNCLTLVRDSATTWREMSRSA